MPVTTSGAQRASRRRSVLICAFGLALGFLVSVGPLSASAVSAPWITAEQYYLRLLNCTRTGGWVVRTATPYAWSWACRRDRVYSSYVKPIGLSSGLSDRASRPYARKLAVAAQCSHFLGSNPASRILAAGYSYPTWGENIGCRDGYSSVYVAVLTSHLVFQSERSTNGGHWRNIKNPRFYNVGIGVWVYAGRTRLVTDFVGR